MSLAAMTSMRARLESDVAPGTAALIRDRRGSGLVQSTILVVALALASVAGVKLLRSAIGSRTDCAGDQIVAMGSGTAPCQDDRQGGPGAEQPPVSPAADPGAGDGDRDPEESKALDELLAIAADIIGFTDAKKCVTEGDILACVMTVLNFTPGKVFGLGFKLIKNANKIRKAVDKFLGIIAARKAKKAADEARRIEEARKAEEAARKAEQAAGKADNAEPPPTTGKPNKPGTLAAKGEPDPERVRELGVNHEQGGVTDLAEGQGGARYEQATGRPLQRSTEEGADFIDSEVGPISLKGPLVNKRTGQPLNINDQMVDGLAKSVIKDVERNTFTKRVVVDTKGMTQAQRDRLRQSIESELAKNPNGPSKEIVFLE